jgi:hypothetical protein
MNKYECPYKEDIEALKTNFSAMQAEIRTELKAIKEDISEIKRKLNGFTSDMVSVKTDIGYLRGMRQVKDNPSNSYWMKFSIGMVKDLAILALMGLISLKAFGVV